MTAIAAHETAVKRFVRGKIEKPACTRPFHTASQLSHPRPYRRSFGVNKAYFASVSRHGLRLMWCAAALVALLGSLPTHPFRMAPRNRRIFLSVFPQGWAFFTRDPREDWAIGYRRVQGGLQVIGGHNASAANWLGMRKFGRAETAQLGIIQAQVPKAAWFSCAQSVEVCLRSLPPRADSALNTATVAAVCGQVVIERRRRVPWAWSQRVQPTAMPGEFAAIRVVCKSSANRS